MKIRVCIETVVETSNSFKNNSDIQDIDDLRFQAILHIQYSLDTVMSSS